MCAFINTFSLSGLAEEEKEEDDTFFSIPCYFFDLSIYLCSNFALFLSLAVPSFIFSFDYFVWDSCYCSASRFLLLGSSSPVPCCLDSILLSSFYILFPRIGEGELLNCSFALLVDLVYFGVISMSLLS